MTKYLVFYTHTNSQGVATSDTVIEVPSPFVTPEIVEAVREYIKQGKGTSQVTFIAPWMLLADQHG